MQVLGFFCSLLIGISLGLLGGGGSMLTLPVLVYLLGINPVVSTAYSLFVVGITSLIGAIHSIQKREINYRVAFIFSIPSLLSIFLVRSLFLAKIPDRWWLADTFILSKDSLIMVFFALIMLVASVSMLSDWRAEAKAATPSFRFHDPLIALAGLFIGAVTGVVGIGGGFLIIPALVLLVRLPMKKAIGTSLLIIAIKSLVSFWGDLAVISINWPFLMAFTAFSVVGILVGSQYAKSISGYRLRRTFGWFLVALSVYILSRETLIATSPVSAETVAQRQLSFKENPWKAPNPAEISYRPDAQLIRYGRALIANTAYYLGPKGKVIPLSNGMNCQNCHLDAGTKPWGNNFGAVAATYPRFRERSGSLETVVKRISDCFERSLNGYPPDSASREMRAMVAYIQFVGHSVPKGESPKGSGIWPLPFLEHAADPVKGELVFRQKCVVCHGLTGRGKRNADGSGFVYPPLWGKNSYNTGAGLYRLSRFAGYIKANMPLGATWDKPQLTDEEAWDLAAYINSQPRPLKEFRKDWPRIEGKPVDHPFGPYADPFPEQQHKYGPFKPIDQYRKKATG